MNNTTPKVICLMGPTASGKTDLSFALAEHLPIEIISVDSTQVYRGMDIGTAKPSKAEQAQVPHHLIDILDPSQPYSAAEFCTDALRCIADIQSRGKLPVLVGGTMLYFHALQQGLAPMPSSDPSIRAQLEYELQAEGLNTLYKELQAIDPVAAARIKPTDPQRIQRALEVYRSSGKTISAWCEQQTPQNLGFVPLNIAIIPSERATLHRRIVLRFTEMIKKGFIAEVEQLYSRAELHCGLPSMRAVGYRQVWDYLAGNTSAAVMQELSVIATRQLAKRQLTWLRSWQDLHRYESDDPQLVQHILKML
jgi:tRNA dimethylallyltransferase